MFRNATQGLNEVSLKFFMMAGMRSVMSLEKEKVMTLCPDEM